MLFPTRGEKKKGYYSFKIKTSALNTQVRNPPFTHSYLNCVQVAVLANGTIAWTSDSKKAGKFPDITHVRHSGFADCLDNSDVVLADRGYQGASFPCCLPYKRARAPRGAPKTRLTPQQEIYNENHAHAR